MLAGDILLLCSDGLTEMVGSYEIEGLLSINEEPCRRPRGGWSISQESGVENNISVILVRVSSVGEVQVRMQQRSKSPRARR